MTKSSLEQMLRPADPEKLLQYKPADWNRIADLAVETLARHLGTEIVYERYHEDFGHGFVGDVYSAPPANLNLTFTWKGILSCQLCEAREEGEVSYVNVDFLLFPYVNGRKVGDLDQGAYLDYRLCQRDGPVGWRCLGWQHDVHSEWGFFENDDDRALRPAGNT